MKVVLPKINMINNYIKRLETNKLIVYQKDLRVLAIYREMSAGSTMNPQTIKNEDVSEKEYALQCHNNLIVFQV